jgi:3-phenylpropionate/trans-cinnamate dioxygenase ferredoxin reductase subunit
VHPATFYAEQRIDLRSATTVRAIEPGSREVVLEGEERVAFDRLLIATGARPRALPVPGANLPGVMTLRTLADADAIRAAAIDAERIVVIGAGWIGSEVAASLRMLGRTVALMAPEAVPLERVLGPEVGGVYRDLHLKHGVDWRPGTTVGRVIGTNRV